MPPTEREACPSCGEPVPLDARVCPYCDVEILVAVRVETGIASGRTRYQVARALGALGGPLADFAAVQTALQSPDRPVVAGVTRAFARQVIEALSAQGVAAEETVSAGKSSGGSRGLRNAAMAAGLVAALAGAGWWAMHSRGPATAGPLRLSRAGGPAAAPLGSRELAQRALASTVVIHCSNSLGSGFFVAPDLLLTNAHVLCPRGDAMKVVLANGREAQGEVVRSDDGLDLALVRASGTGAPALPMGDAGALVTGDKVLMVGSPVGMDFTVHEGMISNASRPILGVTYLQVDAKVNPGNSGGPLVDNRGQVVGIVSMKRMDAEGIGLALPINYAYTGTSPLVAAPVGGSATFASRASGAEEADRKATEGMGTIDTRPGVLDVSLDGSRTMRARILRLAHQTPGFERVSFVVWSDGKPACNVTGDVPAWQAVASTTAGEGNPRLRTWLEKHGLDVQLYMGETVLTWEACPPQRLPPPVDLELDGADPSLAKVHLY